ncbi:MAG: TrkH family potassium uptake protein [Desulfuromonas sp.]|nr:TrkH family potassium uptake protein [Desulfuromonas sp.]
MTDARYHDHLLQRYRVIGSFLGFLLQLLGLIMLLPLLVLFWVPQEWGLSPGFLLAAAPLLVMGWWLRRCTTELEKRSLSLAEGSVIVVIAWLAAIVVGTLPFYWAGLDISRAVFETTSGWTTTGLSVVDVATTPMLLLFYRSLLQLAGGAGLAILLVSVLAIRGGVGVSSAEGHSEQLVPQVRHSARLVIKLYAGYVLVGVIALKLAGMSWFEAVNHSFCALSTGGFSTRAEPLYLWSSPAAQNILMVLMLLGMTNFLTAYTLMLGRWRAVWRNAELKLTLGLLCFALIALWYGTPVARQAGVENLRITLFQVISALSTTGFVITGLEPEGGFSWLLLMVLMLVGGGSGSTAGGIKQQRIVLLFKNLKQHLLQLSSPPHAVHEETVWIGDQQRSLSGDEVRWAGTYVALYLLTWLSGGLILTACGHSMAQSLFEFASTLGTVGLSLGVTGIGSASGQLWVQIAGMLLGRLEFLVLFWGSARLLLDLPVLLARRCS